MNDRNIAGEENFSKTHIEKFVATSASVSLSTDAWDRTATTAERVRHEPAKSSLHSKENEDRPLAKNHEKASVVQKPIRKHAPKTSSERSHLPPLSVGPSGFFDATSEALSEDSPLNVDWNLGGF